MLKLIGQHYGWSERGYESIISIFVAIVPASGLGLTDRSVALLVIGSCQELKGHSHPPSGRSGAGRGIQVLGVQGAPPLVPEHAGHPRGDRPALTHSPLNHNTNAHL